MHYLIHVHSPHGAGDCLSFCACACQLEMEFCIGCDILFEQLSVLRVTGRRFGRLIMCQPYGGGRQGSKQLLNMPFNARGISCDKLTNIETESWGNWGTIRLEVKAGKCLILMTLSQQLIFETGPQQLVNYGTVREGCPYDSVGTQYKGNK